MHWFDEMSESETINKMIVKMKIIGIVGSRRRDSKEDFEQCLSSCGGIPSAPVDCCQDSGCNDWRWCGQYYIGSAACPKCGGMTRTNHHGQWCATCEWRVRTDNTTSKASLDPIVGETD